MRSLLTPVLSKESYGAIISSLFFSGRMPGRELVFASMVSNPLAALCLVRKRYISPVTVIKVAGFMIVGHSNYPLFNLEIVDMTSAALRQGSY